MTKEERLEKQKTRFAEMTVREGELRQDGMEYIAGIDEVGRGPLAGPVYAACVVLPPDFDVLGIDDSKKLTEKQRVRLDEQIRGKALACGIGVATNKEIDELNILNATKLAMKRAVDSAREQLLSDIDYLLIDAVKLDEVDIPQESMIKGDARSLSIAAASIVAKVARDAFMTEMDGVYPGYSFASNKGYGTAAHYEGIKNLGVTPIHRMSFLKKESGGKYTHNTGKEGNASQAKEKSGMTKKIYAVRKGRSTGLFTTWDECKASVEGYSGAEYKSFADIDDAKAYLGIAGGTDVKANEGKATAYVDGSYDAASGRYSGAAVILYDGLTELSECGDDEAGASLRNVAGEITGAKLAISYCVKNGIKELDIYHDYAGIGKWGNDEWKANLDMTRDYKAFVKEAREKVRITFIKVKAHAGNKYNEMADSLTKEALKQ